MTAWHWRTISPIVAASWAIGRWMIGSPMVELPAVTLSALASAEFWMQLAAQWRQLLPFAVGATVLSVVGGALSYPLMLHLLRAYRRRYPALAEAEISIERN